MSSSCGTSNGCQVSVEETAEKQDKEHPRVLIPELCRLFYQLGWVTGTGGGISLRRGEQIYIAPSGVQKERIQPEDMFVCDVEERDISCPPAWKKFKKSQCTPLFMNAYTMRGAQAVIHTHSKAAVMATLLYPGKEFRITHQEMIKGIRKGTSGTNYRYVIKQRGLVQSKELPSVFASQSRRGFAKPLLAKYLGTQSSKTQT
ncbi:methylthioribulose-1-phosphate dehydratase-like [Stegastes partitus]|uniref:Methylthioribulose-1-phosphate dehydratase-like n=1 Tax=Stegastes partitus TaxID=144197 RepID=A0A3B4YZZ7_9TELE|nr:PREDICTED: methylthioribulose-1-phosphate dehydratase-like [Stegastes partitus]